MALSSEIIAKLGLDTAGFSQGLNQTQSKLAAFESRLEQFGVNFNPGQKIARDSARAMEEVFAAQERLAAAQRDNLINESTKIGQIKIIQAELRDLARQRQTLQQGTVERINLEE